MNSGSKVAMESTKYTTWDFPIAQVVKHLQETRVRSLGKENPLEKEMATHTSILARRIPWTEEPVGLQSMGLQRIGYPFTNRKQ